MGNWPHTVPTLKAVKPKLKPIPINTLEVFFTVTLLACGEQQTIRLDGRSPTGTTKVRP
jgi:hypothetical protein